MLYVVGGGVHIRVHMEIWAEVRDGALKTVLGCEMSTIRE